MQAIASELDAITGRLSKIGLKCRAIASKGLSDTKLIIENDDSQVKVEVNVVFRGTVLPVERRPLCARTEAAFSVELELPVLATAELYGSKLVAAMDRQHPRDLFDVWNLYQSGGLSDDIIECFVTYLAGHNRPIHEVLFCNEKDISREYHNNFVGMTTDAPVPLQTLLDIRSQLREELPRRLSERQRDFLLGLSNVEPRWDLLLCPHASELPALRWKLSNLQTFSKRRPRDFRRQANELESKLK